MLTAEEIQNRAAPYLQPISEAEPAGTNASYDPRYEELRNQMVALDSPTGAEVEWAEIEKRGRELLSGVTKDLLIASYTGYALFETQQLSGLAVALEALLGLYERYWESSFPPAKRMRGRGNALDWLVARLEIALPKLQAGSLDRASFDLVQERWRRLSVVARDKLDESCPSMRGVAEALERLELTLPAAAPAPAPSPEAQAATPATNPGPTAVEPAPATQAGPPPPPAAPAGPPPAEPATQAGAVHESAPRSAGELPGPTPAAAEAPAAAEDPLDNARNEAGRWLLPISDASPAGEEARYDNEYEEARSEVARLESLTGEVPEWSIVAKRAGEILERKSKDVLMAAYLAYARFQLDGLSALPAGLMVLHGIFDRYYEGCFPSRARGRANALAWMVGQLDIALGEHKPRAEDRATVQALQAAAETMSSVIRDKMGGDSPSMGDLTQRVQRMLLAIPEPKKEEPKPPDAPTPPPTAVAAAAPAHVAAPAAAVAPGQPMPTVSATIGNAEEVTAFLQETGRALVQAANILRRAQLPNPSAYRLLRAGLWLHLTQPPPAGPGGKTQIPPLPPPRRQQMELMAQNAKWPELLDESESALTQFRFNLDLQRISCKALGELGDAYAPARTAVMAEVASFLARMPVLTELVAADGSPLADEDTLRWLRAEVLAGSGEGGAASSGDDDNETADAFAEIRGMMKGGKATEAMKKAQILIEGADSSRRRFVRRLTLAEACLGAEQHVLARGMFAALERELRDRDLLEWEPTLAGRCLEGFVRSIRAAAKAGSNYEGADAVFERLCLVDPGAAARLSG